MPTRKWCICAPCREHGAIVSRLRSSLLLGLTSALLPLQISRRFARIKWMSRRARPSQRSNSQVDCAFGKLPDSSDSRSLLQSIASALLIRVILTALHPILFAVGQHDFTETHGMRTISRAISYHCNLVARLE